MIDRCAPIGDLAAFRNLVELAHLVIRGTPVLSQDFSPLLELPALAHVYFDEKKAYQPSLRLVEEAVHARQH